MNDIDDRDGKTKIPPRGNSPNEKMHDKKIRSAIPFPAFTTGTKPKSVSVSK